MERKPTYDATQTQLEQDIRNLKMANERMQIERDLDAMRHEIDWLKCQEMAVTDGTFNLGDLQ